MHLRTLAVIIFAVCLTAATAANAVGRGDGKSCKSSEANPYVGTYQWRNARTAQDIRFWFDRIEPAGEGKQRAIGRGVYLARPKPVNIKIIAVIDLKTGRIEIWESSPDSANFTTNGSHVGVISSDFCAINAVWTTKGTGQRGDLTLRIERK